MKSQVLHTVWCNISGEAAGEIWKWLTLALPSSKSTFSQLYKEKWSDAVIIGSIIIFRLSKLWKAKFFILCDVTFPVRLQGKFDFYQAFVAVLSSLLITPFLAHCSALPAGWPFRSLRLGGLETEGRHDRIRKAAVGQGQAAGHGDRAQLRTK